MRADVHPLPTMWNEEQKAEDDHTTRWAHVAQMSTPAPTPHLNGRSGVNAGKVLPVCSRHFPKDALMCKVVGDDARNRGSYSPAVHHVKQHPGGCAMPPAAHPTLSCGIR